MFSPSLLVFPWKYYNVQLNLVLEVPKDMVRRLRGGDDAFDGMRRANIQENLLLTLNLTYRLWNINSLEV